MIATAGTMTSVTAEIRADIEAAIRELSSSDQAVLAQSDGGALDAARALGYTPTEYAHLLHSARRRLRHAVVRRRRKLSWRETAAA